MSKNSENPEFVALLLKNGYIQKGYGYRKVSIVDDVVEIYNWVTIFENKLQMYAYMDGIEEKEYDTNIIEPTVEELQTLINLLIK